MREYELNDEEVKTVYNRICELNLEPYKVEYESDCSELYYKLDEKQYRLIYDRPCDWFLDIIYEGDYD